MQYRYVAFLLMALGCGGASKREPMELGEPSSTEEAPAPPSSSPSAVASTCNDAAANVTRLTAHVTAALGPAVADHCVRDAWGPEVIGCFGAAQDGAGLGLCAAMLPPAQQRALESQNVEVTRPASDCAELLARPVVPPPAAPASLPAASPAAPVLTLPGSSAGQPAARPASASPAASPGGAAPDVAAVAGAPVIVPARRSISARELEALRASGQTQLEPELAERRLMAECNLGRVTVSYKVCIDVAGTPELVELTRSSRLYGYDEKLARAISRWRYRPYAVAGKPMAACGAVTIAYQLPAPASSTVTPTSGPSAAPTVPR